MTNEINEGASDSAKTTTECTMKQHDLAGIRRHEEKRRSAASCPPYDI